MEGEKQSVRRAEKILDRCLTGWLASDEEIAAKVMPGIASGQEQLNGRLD
jgi:hypothetical protein